MMQTTQWFDGLFALLKLGCGGVLALPLTVLGHCSAVA
jgi:hypothetical protein